MHLVCSTAARRPRQRAIPRSRLGCEVTGIRPQPSQDQWASVPSIVELSPSCGLSRLSQRRLVHQPPAPRPEPDHRVASTPRPQTDSRRHLDTSCNWSATSSVCTTRQKQQGWESAEAQRRCSASSFCCEAHREVPTRAQADKRYSGDGACGKTSLLNVFTRG